MICDAGCTRAVIVVSTGLRKISFSDLSGFRRTFCFARKAFRSQTSRAIPQVLGGGEILLRRLSAIDLLSGAPLLNIIFIGCHLFS